MSTHPPGVSAAAPVGPAIDRMKQILFRPFDISKWMAIGFCAFLALLGQGGGNYSRSTNNSTGTNRAQVNESLTRGMATAKEYMAVHTAMILSIGVVVFVVIVVLMVLFVWLQSRGTFMFMHCVVLNKGEVVKPWKQYKNEANSLFKFNLCLAFAGLVLVLPFLGAVFWAFYNAPSNGSDFFKSEFPTLVGLMIAFFCLFIPLGIAGAFTRNFVAPIMILRGVSCVQGWGILLSLIADNIGRFIIYILFQIVVVIGIFFVVVIAVICTCCIGAILLFIPYIGSVAKLPITIFLRSYTLMYLAQYGPEFDIFNAAAAMDAAAPQDMLPG
jgi:hypothetical protein